ncbi:MAG: T9SS type A sorting domain-containing protein [Bacteroidales bacterium]|nr:T9SS type A sorting domain-containing protein [Bacteroidales bacterium]
MKRLIIIALLLCAAMAQGQRFEWAKGYDSSHEDAYIKGSVTDSLGNLYILGNIHWDSDWDTIWLMPHLNTQNTMVMVAKISPEGEMVWRKIYGSDYKPMFAHDIRMMGDTGFAVLFSSGYNNYPFENSFFWGDSICHNVYHPRISPYDTPGCRFGLGGITVYMDFDFDGNVIEEHMLQRSFVDTDSNDIVYRPYSSMDSLSWLYLDRLLSPTFDLDSDGNLFICYLQNFNEQALPSICEYNGTVRAMRYWVDHRLVGESSFDNNTKTWYPILLKFSPHFDTLLASRYVVQKNNIYDNSMQTFVKTDKSTNELYLRIFVARDVLSAEDTILIDSVSNIIVYQPVSCTFKGFVVIYDSVLTPNALIEFHDTLYDSGNRESVVDLRDIEFDNDSNLVFISGTVGCRSGEMVYNGIPINPTSGVIVLNKSDLSVHSLCDFPAENHGASLAKGSMNGNLAVKNNRVFLQSHYTGRLILPHGTYSVQGAGNSGLALAVWDYQGNLIDGKNYHTYSRKHDVGPISLVDSTLYLINFLASNATFGSNQVYVSGYKACVAKYVDTAFMSVYRPPLGGIAPGESGPEYSFYPNPVENKLQVDLDGDRILQATAVSVLGVRERLGFEGNTVDVSHLRPGVYVMELTTTHNTFAFKFIKR